nr:YodL domain-containing protein [uncultured Bacillus sp.]
MLKELIWVKKRDYDVTVFQTPSYRQKKGYQQVYRLQVEGVSHNDCLNEVFAIFNVLDRMPKDFQGRFIGTGDILFIDDGRRGQFYYQLKSGGWEKINQTKVC